MSTIFNKGVIKKKVLAKVSNKINKLQAQYDKECEDIDAQYNEKRMALLEELSAISGDKSSDKDALANRLVDTLIP